MLKWRKLLFLLGVLLFAYVPAIHAHSIMSYSENQARIELSATGESFIYPLNSNRVSKVNTDGSIIWSNEYSSFGLIDSSIQYPFNILLLRETGDGGCIIEGSTKENPAQQFSRPQILLMKINGDGTVEWLNRYQNSIALQSYSFPGMNVYDMIKTQEGGYLVSGTYLEDAASNWAFLLKLDSSGKLEWQKKYLIRRSTTIVVTGGGGRIVQVADGGYVLSFKTNGMNPMNGSIIKIDSTGNIQWQKEFKNPTNPGGTFLSYNDRTNILATADRGCIVLEKQNYGIMITKFDIDTGTVVWEKSIYSSPRAYVNHDLDGGFILSSLPINSPNDIDLFAFAQNGDFVWGKRANSSLFSSGNIPPVQVVQTEAGHIKAGSEAYPSPLIVDITSSNTPNTCVKTTQIPLPVNGNMLNIVDASFIAQESVRDYWGDYDLFSVRSANEPYAVVNSTMVAANILCMSNQPPVAEAGPDQLLACAGAGTTTAQLDGSFSFDPDGDPLGYFWSGPFGTSSDATPAVTLPFGSHQITLTVTDPAGETSSDSLSVEIRDQIAPATTAQVSGTSGLNNWYTSEALVKLFASDDCAGSREIHTLLDGAETVTAGSLAETLVAAEGRHLLQYWAVDRAGNSEQARSLEIAIDMTAPLLTLPGALVAEAQSAAGAVVGYTVTTSDNLDPAPALACTPASPATIAIGSATVSCTSVDAAGNAQQGSFTVTVADTTPPVVTPPAAITQQYRGKKTVINLGTATVFEAVGIASLVNDAPASFPKGVTTVTWTAVDTSGNVGTAVQTVTLVTGQHDGNDDDEECDKGDKEDKKGHDDDDHHRSGDDDHHHDE